MPQSAEDAEELLSASAGGGGARSAGGVNGERAEGRAAGSVAEASGGSPGDGGTVSLPRTASLFGAGGAGALRLRSVSPRAPRATTPIGQQRLASDAFAAALQHTERVVEASLKRLDQKVSAVESAQSKLERRSSESAGTLRGLAEEMQSQIRRCDSVEARFLEFRSQVEVDLRQRLRQFESSRHDTLAACRSMVADGDEAQKRLAHGLRRMEGALQCCLQEQEGLSQAVGGAQDRIDSLEDVLRQAVRERAHDEQADQMAAVSAKLACVAQRGGHGVAGDIAVLAGLERQVEKLTRQVEQLLEDAHGERGWQERLEEHEIRLVGIRSKLESACIGGMPASGPPVAAAIAEPPQGSAAAAPPPRRPSVVSACSEGGESAAERLGDLVEQLKGVAPRVIQHETMLRDLRGRLESVEERLDAGRASDGSPCGWQQHTPDAMPKWQGCAPPEDAGPAPSEPLSRALSTVPQPCGDAAEPVQEWAEALLTGRGLEEECAEFEQTLGDKIGTFNAALKNLGAEFH